VTIGQLRSELLKIRSTRTTTGLVLGMVALVVLFTLLTGLLSDASDLATTEDQRSLIAASSFARLFAALAGVMLVTGEYRYGTIRPTFLFTARRARVLEAKVGAGMLAGAVFGIAAVPLGFGIGYACLAGRGIDFALDGSQSALLALGTIAGSAVWGAIGVGVGAVVRNQVGAIIGLLAWGFVVESLLWNFLPGLGRFAPDQAADSLIGLTTNHLLPAAAGGVVLVAWAAALSLAGVAVAMRRDVN
jgi:ABC-2 type transport system permease protein